MQRLGPSIASARVDLNPHQIEAALFALRSPFAKGALLADEVGLGKTIEAGIVLAQSWAEGRRRLLLIVPATLRKQWQTELQTKFGLPSVILDGPAVRKALAGGENNPFDRPGCIVIGSYPFAARYESLISQLSWHLTILDEAHRLRNVWQTGSKQAAAIRTATRRADRLVLLTATPLQNSLLELYGLLTFLDEHAFGSLDSFREQFMTVGQSDTRNRDAALRQRLQMYCKRTLRRDVQEYVRFTRRLPITQKFHPGDDEHTLYEGVSAYLQRDDLLALPTRQRSLMTLVLRKLLASSSFAIALTLRRLVARLEAMVEATPPPSVLPDKGEFDVLDEVRDEWQANVSPAAATAPDPTALQMELAELRHLAAQAEAISYNQKGDTLLLTLPTAFTKLAELGAARKAVIFTESRRTQDYLKTLLESNGYAGQVVTINGSNSEARSQEIYRSWKQQNPGLVSGAKSADVKAALVAEFQAAATILLATESAAEGVNLQFCSLVINYDLPWNPQRVEQRIGRCHRYGQKHDVVVVNFLNERNAADQRVFELLSLKFKLFEGVFGASDEILGALLAGVDLERRILDLYQSCRTAAQIETGFNALRNELEGQIEDRMGQTRRAVLDHLDADVHERLRIHYDQARALLDYRQQTLFCLARQELKGTAQFAATLPQFEYAGPLAPTGSYHLDWREAEAQGGWFFAPGTALADVVLQQARDRLLPPAHLLLNLSVHPARIALLEPLLGQAGWLTCVRLHFEAAAPEDHLLVVACLTDGTALDTEQACKLLDISMVENQKSVSMNPPSALLNLLGLERAARRERAESLNATYFAAEADKLDRWADDLKLGLETELKQLDREIRETQRTARAMTTLQAKLDAQKLLRSQEAERAQKRRRLYQAQDEIDGRRTTLIDELEKQLQLRETAETVFTFYWSLI